MLMFAAACAAPPPTTDVVQQTITGGEPTAVGAWSTVAWLDNGCSGVLIAPDIVVYAGHCGAQATRAWFGDAFDVVVTDDSAPVTESSAATPVDILECRVHPQSELASGTDVAFCWLVEPVLAARLIPPVALGCAHEQLQPGVPLTLVGYGVDGSGLEALGTKRSITAEIGAIGREITVGDEERGPCSGDSGGPAFMSLSASDGASEWVLAGILSSGVEGSRCSTGYYTDLSQVMTWLESETGRDLTPCFDGVTWRPTERCLRAALDEHELVVLGRRDGRALALGGQEVGLSLIHI